MREIKIMQPSRNKQPAIRVAVFGLVILLATAFSPGSPDLRLALRSQSGHIQVRVQGLARVSVDIVDIASVAKPTVP